MKIKKSELRNLIREELARETMSEGLRFHVDQGAGIERNIYRPGSDQFFALFREVRSLHQKGLYEANEE